MKRLILFTITLFVLVPAVSFAQQSEEDPFKRDPIFNKSLEELFGMEQTSVDSARVESDERSDAERVARRLSYTGVDLGGGFEAGPYYSNELYSQYPNLPMIHFNRVNGLFLGIRKERMQWHRYSSFLDIEQIHPHGFIGYGTASKDWEYALGLEKLIGVEKRLMIGGEFHKATSTEDHDRIGLIENSITSFFASYDFQDYHQMEGFGLYAAYRTQRWIEASFSYNRDTFRSLERNTTWSLFGKASPYRINPAIDVGSDEIDLDRYSFALSFNPRNVLLANRFTFAATVGAELADNSESDENYRYNKYWSELKLFYNFEPGSVLRWRLKAGGITGDVPDFKQFYLGGVGTLRGSPYKYFRGDNMLLSNLEVQFGRSSSQPGVWMRDYNMHILLFLDSGWTKDTEFVDGPVLADGPEASATSGFSSFKFSDLHHDAGFGLGTGAFRAEIAWPLKEFDGKPAFWIRFNPTF
ncbi:hypothetical protein [Rhodohalobacter barkolensis]|uniref:Bacterial surface antigen (D15) domain-containing protein n=1 Tax=Rhodohalobacter barkolensis TaxID=2053187 RepID=A0A2N0VKS9_9BACT|nr:hypothetical protein [Rhodohalobacter barkolensis]PKD44805.1 hypothetical protein CWD77_04900 [Rhodohalobacter barkolensis]